jgi:chromate transporter
VACARRARALLGGLSFIVPGLVAIVALAMLFLRGSPPVALRAAGMGAGALLAAAIAFAPSFSFVLVGAARFERLLASARVRAFLAGAAPAAAGAIVGAAVPLAGALAAGWQLGILAGAAIVLLALRRGIVTTLLLAAAAGLAAALLGARVPH